MHLTGDREDNVEWSGDTQEILTAQAYSSVPNVKKQIDENAWTI